MFAEEVIFFLFRCLEIRIPKSKRVDLISINVWGKKKEIKNKHNFACSV